MEKRHPKDPVTLGLSKFSFLSVNLRKKHSIRDYQAEYYKVFEYLCKVEKLIMIMPIKKTEVVYIFCSFFKIGSNWINTSLCADFFFLGAERINGLQKELPLVL